MDPIIQRLFESKRIMNTEMFNAKDNSDEAWDAYDIIQSKVVSSIDKIFPDVEVDDSGLDSRGSISGDRTIIYRARNVSRFRSGKSIPLNKKEWERLKNELEKEIVLPDDDGTYSYSTDFHYSGKELEIVLRRRELV